MSDRPFAINGGEFGKISREFADWIRSFGPQPAPVPGYQEVLAEEQRKAAAMPKPDDRPYGINGGKFGNSARAAADKSRAVLNEIPPAFANYGKDRELGMEILAEFLRRKFGQ